MAEFIIINLLDPLYKQLATHRFQCNILHHDEIENKFPPNPFFINVNGLIRTKMKETGNPPDNKILQQLLKTNVEIIEKLNAISKELVHFKEISRLITEIHKLHFPKDESSSILISYIKIDSSARK